jgi:hypothetical protein
MVTDTLKAIREEAESGDLEALKRIWHLVEGLLKHRKIEKGER